MIRFGKFFFLFLLFSSFALSFSSSGGDYAQFGNDGWAPGNASGGDYSVRSLSGDAAATTFFGGGKFGRWGILSTNLVPEVLSLNFPPDSGWVSDSNVNFTFNASDDHGFDNCSLWTNESGSFAFAQLNQSEILNDSENGINYTFAADGCYLWNILCWDNGEDVEEKHSDFYDSNYSFCLDSSNPVVFILLPENTTYGYKEDLPLNYTVSADATACWYSVDGNANVSLAGCANSTIPGPLAEGPHDVIVYANDSAGNEGSDQEWFSIDISAIFVPPTPPDAFVTIEFPYDATINATTSANLVLQECELEWQGANESMNVAVGNLSCLLDKNDLDVGVYRYRAFLFDGADWFATESRSLVITDFNKGKTFVNIGLNESADYVPAYNITPEEGGISNLSIEGITSSYLWQAVFGNVTGSITLSDYDDFRMRSWELIDSSVGNIYVSRKGHLVWGNITAGNLSECELLVSSNENSSDSCTNTFYDTGDIAVWGKEIEDAPQTWIWKNNTEDNSTFAELLLEDNTYDDGFDMVFAAKANWSQIGYNASLVDYQLVMPTGKLHSEDPEAVEYFFWVELE